MAIDLMAELENENATADATEVDKASESAGGIPPGKYAARLEAAAKKDIAEIPTWNLTFLITDGAFRNRKIFYTLWMGTKETDKEGDTRTKEEIADIVKGIKNEYWHTAGVLGLAVKTMVDGKPNYKYVAGKRDFRDVLGNECVVKTKIRNYKTANGEDRSGSEVEKFGVLSFADPKAKGVARPAAGTAPPVSATATAAGREDLSDLAAGV